MPVAGSAYTFSYTSLGEFPAWVIGWDLVSELALAAAVRGAGSGRRHRVASAGADVPQPATGRLDA